MHIGAQSLSKAYTQYVFSSLIDRQIEREFLSFFTFYVFTKTAVFLRIGIINRTVLFYDSYFCHMPPLFKLMQGFVVF